jgi:hypothetical protein
MAKSPLDRVLAIGLALPLVNERLSHGCPTLFINDKKTFVMFVNDHHGDGNIGIWCAAPPGDQQARIAEDPERFFRPPYVGPRGWVGVRLNLAGHNVTDAELEELITEAWRCVAPKRALAAFDAGKG